jgi:hypothetical protein
VAPPAVPAIDAALWERLVAEAAAADGSLAGILVQAVPTELSARRVRVAFPEGATAAELLRQPRWRESFRAAAGRVFGAGVSVEIDDRSSEAARAIATRAQEQRATEERLRQEILDHPAVRETLRAFAGSRVVDVRAGTGGGQGGKER